MSAPERLTRYLQRMLAALHAYGELQGRISESIRTGADDALALQAGLDRSAAVELGQLDRAIAALRVGRRGGPAEEALRELERGIERERTAVLEANRRNRQQLSGALEELRARIQELKGAPRTASSPFSRIGRPTLVDFHT